MAEHVHRLSSPVHGAAACTPAIVAGSGLGTFVALRLLYRAGIQAYSLPTVASHESRSL